MGSNLTLTSELDFDLLLPDLDAVGQVVQVDLARLPPARALEHFRADLEQRIDQLRQDGVGRHRCVMCGSQAPNATPEEVFEMNELPLLPYDEQLVLVHYAEPLAGVYYPGTPPVARRFKHHVLCRQRRSLEELLDRCPGAYPFYATARPACAVSFDWPALAGLIQLARGPVSDYELLDEFLHREQQAGARSRITRSDLLDFFQTGETHRIYRRHARPVAWTVMRQLEALAAALETDTFDALRAELDALPADAFAFQAAV